MHPSYSYISLLHDLSFIVADIIAINDFSYDMGQNQSQLYIDTDTPLNVNVTVYNAHYLHKPFYYGRANFMFKLYLHFSDQFIMAGQSMAHSLQIGGS